MKLGSLFDGIGTFPLSGLQFGFIPIWASEIEAFPIAVTKHHFPDMKHLGDITKINGAEIEPVDVITFGSPCQDMSVAGKREGLCGARSGLFMEAVRIIREMRTATSGQYPRFAVWENVPGAYNSNNGQDFRAVLEEISQVEIPMPASGKWAEAGMVRTESVDIAWRTLDAQYWGVPQRRKRIFLVADFGGQCAGEILFVEPRLPWNSKTSGEAREEAAGDAGDGVESTIYGFIGKNSAKTRGIGIGVNLSPTIDTTNNVQIAICPSIGFDNQTGQSEGIKVSPSVRSESHGSLPCVASRINCTPEGITGAVSSKWAKGTGGPAGDEHYNLVVEPQLYDMTHAEEVMRPVEAGIAPTLNSRMGTGGNQGSMIGRADKNGPQGDGVNEEVSFTLNTTDRHAVAYGIDQQGGKGGANYAENISPALCSDSHGTPHAVAYPDPANALLAKANLSFRNDQDTLIRTGYAVRRLTPLEYERLQGLPDGYTNIEGAKDTNRYKAIGNGIAKPCSDFVLGGIARVMKGVGEVG